MSKYIELARKKYLYRAVNIIRLWFRDGTECVVLRCFLQFLINSGYSYNTIRNYGNTVAQYLDYLLVGFSIIGGCTPYNALVLTRHYYSYLVYGEESHDPNVRAIARIKPSPKVLPKSAGLYHAAIVQFLLVLKIFQTNKTSYEKVALSFDPKIDSFIEDSLVLVIDQLMVNIPQEKKNNHRRVSRLYLFGHVTLDVYGREVVTDKDFFPLQHISQLIIAFGEKKQYRNAALCAMCAASSERVSEALQTLICDIDFKDREIFVVNPDARVRDDYIGLSEVERNKLSWKGRRTALTLLLEPYGSLFFHYAELYIKYQRPANSGNNFLFQTADGDPLFLSDYGSVVLAPFKATAKKVLAGTRYHDYDFTIHSLRHSYCVYFKNFVETTDGFGLTNAEIMLLTGHASEDAVKIYATASEVLVREKIALAYVQTDGMGTMSYDNLMIGFHERRVAAIKDRIAREAEALRKKAA